MKKKLGPLPIWAWALVAGGTIGAVLLVKKGKASTGTTGEVIPELAGQAMPQGEGGGGGGSAGSLEAAEAKQSAENESLRQLIAAQSERHETTSGGIGTGIGEVLEAKEALEALGLVRPLQGGPSEPSSAGKSPVKQATGKAPAVHTASSSRGKYRTGTFRGHAAHIYSSRVHGGVGPGGNIIVLGGPAKAGHAQAGSHAPHHVSKPPAHHTAAKPTHASAKHAASHGTPAAHAPAPAAHRAAPAPKPAPKPAPRRPAPKPAPKRRR